MRLIQKTVYRRTAAWILMGTVLLAGGRETLGQGTAGGPFTNHYSTNNGTTWYAGGPNDQANGPAPFPIDLDPTGPPWTKLLHSEDFTGQPNTIFPFVALRLFETIVNVGTEPWTDWHERLRAPVASDPGNAVWTNVYSVLVNGSPITYSQTGLSTDTLDFLFSTPVLPGQTLEIFKEFQLTTSSPVFSGPAIAVEQFPTPEPASAALLAVGALLLRRRGLKGTGRI